MLVVLDFWTSTIDEVIDRVRDMDRALNEDYTVTGALQCTLPREEDL